MRLGPEPTPKIRPKFGFEMSVMGPARPERLRALIRSALNSRLRPPAENRFSTPKSSLYPAEPRTGRTAGAVPSRDGTPCAESGCVANAAGFR